MDYYRYWSSGCKVFSMREGYHSELPTEECECLSAEDASKLASEWQEMEDLEWDQAREG